MTHYAVYFNQQWVGDHTEEWFAERGPLANSIVEEIKAAGAYVYAGGLDHDGPIFTADPNGDEVVVMDGPYAESKEYLGGLTIIDVPDEETARMWAGRIAEACGWPMETRVIR